MAPRHFFSYSVSSPPQSTPAHPTMSTRRASAQPVNARLTSPTPKSTTSHTPQAVVGYASPPSHLRIVSPQGPSDPSLTATPTPTPDVPTIVVHPPPDESLLSLPLAVGTDTEHASPTESGGPQGHGASAHGGVRSSSSVQGAQLPHRSHQDRSLLTPRCSRPVRSDDRLRSLITGGTPCRFQLSPLRFRNREFMVVFGKAMSWSNPAVSYEVSEVDKDGAVHKPAAVVAVYPEARLWVQGQMLRQREEMLQPGILSLNDQPKFVAPSKKFAPPELGCVTFLPETGPAEEYAALLYIMKEEKDRVWDKMKKEREEEKEHSSPSR
ncbi:hypothetical protein FA95DRAFT_1675489 [Auriscalpium vulgare]|uniref:Uncharacterized protein n=1 Tax=Auriscalpium vulgare TaxID=40419 RepID=A0ACB8S7M3_9AGAM|nr:hypothetical protein FA95DRAFT_1675489 [Auriscalpium vulgare]